MTEIFATCPVTGESGPLPGTKPADEKTADSGTAPLSNPAIEGQEVIEAFKSAHDYDPLGPDSLTWKYFGDWRGMLLGPWSGSMQNLHPKLAAAVWEHSDFFNERWQRLLRSVYPIGGVVFDETPETGRQVRDYHRNIKGIMDNGERYHALDPDVFYWAHSTFWYGNVIRAQAFGPAINEENKRILFEESKAWYAMYGVSMRPVPETYEDFLVYWDYMIHNVLEVHPAATAVLEMSKLSPPPFLPPIPKRLWQFMANQTEKNFTWLATGLYHPHVREMFGLSWTEKDEKRFKKFGKTVCFVMDRLPKRLTQHPRKYDAMQRNAGKVAADGNFLESPLRNAPSKEVRNLEMHYNPENASRRAEFAFIKVAQKIRSQVQKSSV